MFREIVLRFGHVGTSRTAVRAIFGMFELDMVTQIGRKSAGHVAQRTLVVVDVLTHVIAQQALQPKFL